MSPTQSTTQVIAALERWFEIRVRANPIEPGRAVVVAFSGGPDSTALLYGLASLVAAEQSTDRGPLSELRIVAAHLDHALDPDSSRRAQRARRIAERLGIPVVVKRVPVLDHRKPGESLEAVARRMRYAVLEELRIRVGAQWIMTAHHRGDQAETLVMRLLSGSGLSGLSGIKPEWGRIVRPLLDLDPSILRSAALDSDLEPVEDPTNFDRSMLRNRVRHDLLPLLEHNEPGLGQRLGRLAAAVGRSRSRWQRLLAERLRATPEDKGASISIQDFIALAPSLRGPSLDLLHQLAGVPWPASRAARRELNRQIQSQIVSAPDPENGPEIGPNPIPFRISCDCGDGWRWRSIDDRLHLESTTRRSARAGDPRAFSYTLEAQGSIEIVELDQRLTLERVPVEPWMFEGSSVRAALAGPVQPPPRVEIRNRRPGDRLQPLGAPGSRRLKEILIDRRVPRDQRDRIPLTLIDGKIAWVPGITIDEAFRLTDEKEVWMVSIEPLPRKTATAEDDADER